MKILTVRASKLRNEEHFQFQTEFKGLVEQQTPLSLNIETAWADYLPVFNNEAAVVDAIRKSSFTPKIADADHNRDRLFSGLKNTVKGALNHFNPAVREAAQRVMIVLDNFEGINEKSLDSQTAALTSLITDLTTVYAADVATLGIGDWVTELESANNAFVALTQERYSEEAAKPQFNMKTARTETDAAYRTIIERIDALIIVNGPAAYETFVAELNERVESFNNNIARREGGEEE
jgi:hypothetical protein